MNRNGYSGSGGVVGGALSFFSLSFIQETHQDVLLILLQGFFFLIHFPSYVLPLSMSARSVVSAGHAHGLVPGSLCCSHPF